LLSSEAQIAFKAKQLETQPKNGVAYRDSTQKWSCLYIKKCELG